jgi:integrase
MQAKRIPPGIRVRHSRTCASSTGGRCNCDAAYEAWVWDKRTRKKIRRRFSGPGAVTAAKQWRADAFGAVRRRTLRPPTQTTLREAAETWLAGAKSGAIRNRSGDVFKPSTLHGYERTLRTRILPVLGGARLSDISRADIQDFAERMLAEGKDPSTVRNAIMPLRVIFGRAVEREEIAINPTTALRLPAVRGRRDRIVDPQEALRLLGQLSEEDRVLWATALFGGLRRGELLALRWSDVDLAQGVLQVERSYDPRSSETVHPKSRAGVRRVPIAAVLRDYLLEHRARCTWDDGLVFGTGPAVPFDYMRVIRRAGSAWRAGAVEDARLLGATESELRTLTREFTPPLTLHEARHTFASMMIAAGVNAKALSTYLGHSSIQITFDRYGRLMPGNEQEAAGLLDAFLQRADTAARLAQLEDDGESET